MTGTPGRATASRRTRTRTRSARSAFGPDGIAVRQQRRRLELQRRRPAGAARPEPRQPGRQDPAHRPDDRQRAAGQPLLRRRRTRAATGPRSGLAACATRSASRSTRPTASPTSATSAGTTGRRSTPARAPTSAGPATRAAPPTRATRERRHDEPRAVRRTGRAARPAAACAALYDQGLGAVRGPGLHVRPHRRAGAPRTAGAFYTGTSPTRASTAARCSSPTTTAAGSGTSRSTPRAGRRSRLRDRPVVRSRPADHRPGHEPLLDAVRRQRRRGAPHPLRRSGQHAARVPRSRRRRRSA